jgi:hypothetical protein
VTLHYDKKCHNYLTVQYVLQEKMKLTTPLGSTVTSYYSCFVSFLVLYDSIAPRRRAVISGLKEVHLQRKEEWSGRVRQGYMRG